MLVVEPGVGKPKFTILLVDAGPSRVVLHVVGPKSSSTTAGHNTVVSVMAGQ